MSDDPAKPPRFPYISALLAVGSLCLAGWLWMEYSYRWDIRPADINNLAFLRMQKNPHEAGQHPMLHRYVRVSGRLHRTDSTVRGDDRSMKLWCVSGEGAHARVRLPESAHVSEGAVVSLVGRVSCDLADSIGFEGMWVKVLFLDTTAPRIVVAPLFGLFLALVMWLCFALALWGWMRGERPPPPQVIACEVTLGGCFRHFRVVFFALPLMLLLPLTAHLLSPADVGVSDVLIWVFALLATEMLLVITCFFAYLVQRKRRVTVSMGERTVLFQYFPVAESFFKTRVHPEVLVAFSDISRVHERLTPGGGISIDVVCPAGQLRVYCFMTNFGQLRRVLSGLVSGSPERGA